MSDLTQKELSNLRREITDKAQWATSSLGIRESLALLDMAERTVKAEKALLSAAFVHLSGGDPEIIVKMVEDMSVMQERAEAAEAKVAKLREALELMAATASLPAYEQGIAEKALEETR